MAEQQKPGEFKTAVVGGFKKADVLAYIEQLTAQNQAEKQAQQQAADKLRQEVEQLKKDKSSCLPAASRRWSRPARRWKNKSRPVPASWTSSRQASGKRANSRPPSC